MRGHLPLDFGVLVFGDASQGVGFCSAVGVDVRWQTGPLRPGCGDALGEPGRGVGAVLGIRAPVPTAGHGAGGATSRDHSPRLHRRCPGARQPNQGCPPCSAPWSPMRLQCPAQRSSVRAQGGPRAPSTKFVRLSWSPGPSPRKLRVSREAPRGRFGGR